MEASLTVYLQFASPAAGAPAASARVPASTAPRVTRCRARARAPPATTARCAPRAVMRAGTVSTAPRHADVRTVSGVLS